MDVYSLTPAQIGAFQQYLREEERSPGTVRKYLRDVEAFSAGWTAARSPGRRQRRGKSICLPPATRR